MRRDSLIEVAWALDESLDELLEHLRTCARDPGEKQGYIIEAIERVKEIKERIG